LIKLLFQKWGLESDFSLIVAKKDKAFLRMYKLPINKTKTIPHNAMMTMRYNKKSDRPANKIGRLS
jgi:hypothetical protein